MTALPWRQRQHRHQDFGLPQPPLPRIDGDTVDQHGEVPEQSNA
jgi:hypothetical protein